MQDTKEKFNKKYINPEKKSNLYSGKEKLNKSNKTLS
jgi:hypothetical protein